MTKRYVKDTVAQPEGVKDSNGIFLPPTPKTEIKDPPKSDINLNDLLDSHLLLLYRQTRALLIASAQNGLLGKDESHCMRENLKLIMELKKKEKELLDELSDEEIERLIEAKLNNGKTQDS